MRSTRETEAKLREMAYMSLNEIAELLLDNADEIENLQGEVSALEDLLKMAEAPR